MVLKGGSVACYGMGSPFFHIAGGPTRGRRFYDAYIPPAKANFFRPFQLATLHQLHRVRRKVVDFLALGGQMLLLSEACRCLTRVGPTLPRSRKVSPFLEIETCSVLFPLLIRRILAVMLNYEVWSVIFAFRRRPQCDSARNAPATGFFRELRCASRPEQLQLTLADRFSHIHHLLVAETGG